MQTYNEKHHNPIVKMQRKHTAQAVKAIRKIIYSETVEEKQNGFIKSIQTFIKHLTK